MKCPVCKGKSTLQTRIHRNLFFKLLYSSKAYKCYDCESKYLQWFSLVIPIKIKNTVVKTIVKPE